MKRPRLRVEKVTRPREIPGAPSMACSPEDHLDKVPANFWHKSEDKARRHLEEKASGIIDGFIICRGDKYLPVAMLWPTEWCWGSHLLTRNVWAVKVGGKWREDGSE